MQQAEELGLWTEVSFRTSGLGRIAFLTGDYARADVLHERADGWRSSSPTSRPRSTPRSVSVCPPASQGRLDDAEAHLTKWLDWLSQVGGTPGIAFILAQLGFVAEQRGDFHEAQALHQQGYEAAQRVGDERAIALALEGLAGAAEDPTAPAGYSPKQKRSGEVGAPLPPAERFDVDRIRARLQT